VVACGAGTGAVVALDLLVRRSELIGGAVLVEPPLLQLLPVATEALSEDRHRLEIAMGTGESVTDLFLSGALAALGPGVDRLSDEVRAMAREHSGSLIAELGLATGWRLSLPELAAADRPSAVLTAASTPALLRDASAALAERLQGSGLRELDSAELPPHLGAPDEVADAALGLSP
jgi:pimeloyl-ACP methyl ester carboxylesterase